MPTVDELVLKELAKLSQEYGEFRNQVDNNEFTEGGAEVNTSHFIFLGVMQSCAIQAAILLVIENIYASQEKILTALRNVIVYQENTLPNNESIRRNDQHLVSCPMCDLPFKSEDDLSRHNKNWHS